MLLYRLLALFTCNGRGLGRKFSCSCLGVGLRDCLLPTLAGRGGGLGLGRCGGLGGGRSLACVVAAATGVSHDLYKTSGVVVNQRIVGAVEPSESINWRACVCAASRWVGAQEGADFRVVPARGHVDEAIDR